MKKPVGPMSRLIAALDSALKASIIIMMIGISLAVLWQVLSRYLLQSPSSGSEELARFLLIWIALIGAVWAYRNHAHLGLDVLVNRMRPEYQQATTLVCHVVVLVFSASVLVYGGAHLVALTFDPVQLSPALGIHIGYVYAVLPLSGILMSIYAIREIVDTVVNGKSTTRN